MDLLYKIWSIIINHEYSALILGVWTYHIFRYSTSKNKSDKVHKKFKFWRWWWEELDDITLSMAIASAVIILDDEFYEIYNMAFKANITEMSKTTYYLTGLFIDRFIAIIKMSKEDWASILNKIAAILHKG